jgi:hypothetical protein
MALPGAIHRFKAFACAVSGSPMPEREPDDGCSASAALQRLRGPGDGAATAKYEVFAITVNGRNTIGVVSVDLERGVPVGDID